MASAVSKLSGLSQRSQWKRVAAKLGVKYVRNLPVNVVGEENKTQSPASVLIVARPIMTRK